MSFRLGPRLYGSAVIAAHMVGSRKVPTLPREKLDALRDSRIRRIVRYAARSVPYYRQMFRDLGVDPRGIRGASDLDRLPILEKEFVRAHSELFLSEASPARNPLSFLSSGSTGRRLEIHHDRRSILANIAFGERERGAVNRLCGGSFRPKELYVSYPTSTFKAVIAFYEENTLRAVKPRRVFVPLSEPIEKIVEIANAEKPDILVGYGAWVDMFFKTVAARGLNVHLPKLVMYIGETLPPGGRAHIEQNFGVPVLSRYNAVESFKIGYFCEEISGFHIHEDLCHVRIVGDDGADLGPGEQGALVMSNLINRATVLLNYPIGDMAAWAEAPCSCGRTFRLMSELEGRVEDVIRLAGGGFVHPRSVWQIFKADPEVLQYQVVQHESARFAVFLATVDRATYERARDRALPGLRALLGNDAVIDVTWRETSSTRGKEKFRPVESRLGRLPHS